MFILNGRIAIIILFFIIALGVTITLVVLMIKKPSIKKSLTPSPAPAPVRPTTSPAPAPVRPVTSPSPTPSSPVSTAPVAPHLLLRINPNVNNYRAGCIGALNDKLFPFSSFNTDGKFNPGIAQDYYTYDTWGFGGDCKVCRNNALSLATMDQNVWGCGRDGLTGPKYACPEYSQVPKSGAMPWTDEQCNLCANASKDPKCRWSTDECPVNNKKYHGIDISECRYDPAGGYNKHRLCCDPSVA